TRALAADPNQQQTAQHLLGVVDELSNMNHAAARRSPAARQQLLSQIGDAVVGMGERQPVEATERPSERNRRVVLLFPPAAGGDASSLCQGSPQ
ncbi:MAG: hypothetical protein ACRD5F_06055, partial [Candidatus Acidiferrales bacterium]